MHTKSLIEIHEEMGKILNKYVSVCVQIMIDSRVHASL